LLTANIPSLVKKPRFYNCLPKDRDRKEKKHPKIEISHCFNSAIAGPHQVGTFLEVLYEVLGVEHSYFGSLSAIGSGN
jgi:hypothetical protein